MPLPRSRAGGGSAPSPARRSAPPADRRALGPHSPRRPNPGSRQAPTAVPEDRRAVRFPRTDFGRARASDTVPSPGPRRPGSAGRRGARRSWPVLPVKALPDLAEADALLAPGDDLVDHIALVLVEEEVAALGTGGRADQPFAQVVVQLRPAQPGRGAKVAGHVKAGDWTLGRLVRPVRDRCGPVQRVVHGPPARLLCNCIVASYRIRHPNVNTPECHR